MSDVIKPPLDGQSAHRPGAPARASADPAPVNGLSLLNGDVRAFGPVEDSDPIQMVLASGEGAPAGRFRFFCDGERWQWSEAVAQMYGYQHQSVPLTTELVLRHAHPDDVEQVAACLRHILKAEPFSSRHRITDTNGRTHWVVVVADRLSDSVGTPIGASGFYIDVTEALQSDIRTTVAAASASRARIEQAKGVLMAAYGISADRAFDILVWRSQQTNMKLRDVADRFLDAYVAKLSPDSLLRVDHALLTLTAPSGGGNF